MQNCGKNMRWRKAYTRKVGTKIVKVKGSCIRSQTRYAESTKNKIERMTKRMTSRMRGIRMSNRTVKSCPAGYIMRKAFVRISKKGKRTLVPAACISDKGAPGKGIAGRPGIGPLRKGELAKYGYVAVAKLGIAERHSALKKAIEEYGSLSVWRKLNAVHIYTRRTSPATSAVLKEDMDWIRKTFGLKAF
jgi:hypothetical protein